MTMATSMEVSADKFKAKCLELIDQVARTGEPLIITRRGKPVARLMPMEAPVPRASLFGYMAGTATILSDIVKVPHDSWAAESGDDAHLYVPAEPRPKRARNTAHQ